MTGTNETTPTPPTPSAPPTPPTGALERRYRRLIGFLPRAYREARAEEMLTTLLDDARPGQHRPSLTEAASVLSLAVRLRFGAPGAGNRGRAAGEIARKAIIANLVLVTAADAYTPARFMTGSAQFGGGPGVDSGALDSAAALSSMLLAAALILGWRRVGRVLAAITLVALTVHMVYDVRQLSFFVAGNGFLPTYGPTVAFWALESLTVVMVFPAFHSDAPRLPARRWWFLTWLLLTGYTVLASGTGIYVYAAALAAAIAIAMVRVRTSPVWPVALVLAAWPLLLYGVIAVSKPPLSSSPDVLYYGLTYSLEGVLLLLALVSFGFRRRRTMTA